MKKSLLLMLTILLLVLLFAGTVQAKKPLDCIIEYTFVGAVIDGRFIAWEGPITGDIEGTIRWYAGPEPMIFTGQASHYSDFWEIEDLAGDIILRGADQTGSTTVRHGKNSNWRTNGVVTEAYGDYEYLLGRKVHQSGHFTWTVDGMPEQGDGILRIN